jgi:hypothetical protein
MSAVITRDGMIQCVVDLSLVNKSDAALMLLNGYDLFLNPYEDVKTIRDNINLNGPLHRQEIAVTSAFIKKGEEIRKRSLAISPKELSESPNEIYNYMLNYKLKTAAALAECEMQTVCWLGKEPTSLLKVLVPSIWKGKISYTLLPSLAGDRDRLLYHPPLFMYASVLFHFMFKCTNAFDFSLSANNEFMEFKPTSELSTLQIHLNYESVTQRRFYEHPGMFKIPLWSLSHINKTCSHTIQNDPDKFQKICKIAQILRDDQPSLMPVFLDNCSSLAMDYQNNHKYDYGFSDDYHKFLLYVLRILCITEYVIPKILCTVYSKIGESKTKLFDYCIDITNRYFVEQQHYFSAQNGRMELTNPSEYLNLPDVSAKNITSFLDGCSVDMTSQFSDKKNAHLDSDYIKSISSFVDVVDNESNFHLKMQLASLPIVFYLPFYASQTYTKMKNYKIPAIKVFTSIQDARGLKDLNTEFILNAVTGYEEYYICAIVCNTSNYVTYMRDFNKSWFSYGYDPSDTQTKLKSDKMYRQKIDFDDNSEPNKSKVKDMIDTIRVSTIGVWCIRKSVFDMYCMEIGGLSLKKS